MIEVLKAQPFLFQQFIKQLPYEELVTLCELAEAEPFCKQKALQDAWQIRVRKCIGDKAVDKYKLKKHETWYDVFKAHCSSPFDAVLKILKNPNNWKAPLPSPAATYPAEWLVADIGYVRIIPILPRGEALSTYTIEVLDLHNPAKISYLRGTQSIDPWASPTEPLDEKQMGAMLTKELTRTNTFDVDTRKLTKKAVAELKSLAKTHNLSFKIRET